MMFKRWKYLKEVERAARELIYSNDQERVFAWHELERLLVKGGRR